jgi:hypothetical protein
LHKNTSGSNIEINAEQKHYALYCSLEGIQAFTEPEKGIPAIVKNTVILR